MKCLKVLQEVFEPLPLESVKRLDEAALQRLLVARQGEFSPRLFGCWGVFEGGDLFTTATT